MKKRGDRRVINFKTESTKHAALVAFIALFLVTVAGFPFIAFAGDVKAKLSSNDGSDAFQVMDNYTSVRLHVRSDGKVGIGTATPTEKLDVSGTVKATAFVGDGSALTGISTGIGFSQYYTTGLQTFAHNNLYERAHGLGGSPTLVIFELVCVGANGGYAIGDKIPFTNFIADNSGTRSAGYNDTYVFYKIGDNGFGSLIANKTGTGFIHIPDPAQWRINVHAWR